MQLLKLSLFILVFILLFSSCQDDPTSLGKDLIGNQLEILVIDSNTDSLAQSSSSFITDSLSFGAAPRLLLGNLDYVKSTMLIRFGTLLPESTIVSLENGNLKVLSAEVELRPSYKIGDVSQQFDFTVHKITSEWGSQFFDKDSLSMLTYEPDEITQSKSITDSLITFNVDTTDALEWLNSFSGDSLANNYGMIFLPSSGSNLIYGFRAFPFVSNEDSPRMKFIVENENNNIDTISTQVVFDVHIPDGTVAATPDQRLQLTAGLGQRGKLYFDLSKIPTNVNINKAELVLQIDSANSVVGSPDADSLRVHLFADSSGLVLDEDLPTLRLYFNGSEFKGDITRYVQSIASGKENQGMQLALSNEIDAVDKYVIYGSQFADRSLRPRLTIYYNVFE